MKEIKIRMTDKIYEELKKENQVTPNVKQKGMFDDIFNNFFETMTKRFISKILDNIEKGLAETLLYTSDDPEVKVTIEVVGKDEQ